jgi:hypothetical protein
MADDLTQPSSIYLSRCISSTTTLVQHVKIELALADVTSIVVDALHSIKTVRS